MLAERGPVAEKEPAKVVANTRHGRKFTEPEEMEVGQVTAALAQQLHIDDIDSSDADNPQLCAEYVKEIYQYMRELEVSLNISHSLISQGGCRNRLRIVWRWWEL